MDRRNIARAAKHPAGRGLEVRNLHTSLPPVRALPTEARRQLASFARFAGTGKPRLPIALSAQDNLEDLDDFRIRLS
jgi:hypothetical protein